MSDSVGNIEKALELQADGVLTPVYGANIQWPNVNYDPVAGTPWARVDHLHAHTSRASAGIDGQTLRPGILQITVSDSLGTGRAGLRAAIRAIEAGFLPGLGLTLNGTTLRVVAVTSGPMLREDGWASVPISIDWLAYTND